MSWFNTIAILVVAYLVVFLQATFNEFRQVTGAQMDLLPSLTVYAALSGGLATMTVTAVCGGLLLDSLSANPMGVSMLPLFLVGLVIQRNKELILREQPYAQLLLGLSASAAVPVMTVIILLNLDTRPLVGWFSLWQWMVMSLMGALVTPLWFACFEWIGTAFSYRPVGEGGHRPDREIKRGRQ